MFSKSIDVMAVIEDLQPEEALAILGACRARIEHRVMTSRLQDSAKDEPQLLTAKEAAQRLSISPKTVYAKQDQLDAVPVGSRGVRFPADAVERAVREGIS